jgi:chromate reductase
MKIIALSGSLRAESYTTKLVKAFQRYAPNDVDIEIVDISKLPFINQDLEAELPQSVIDLHTTINKADAVIFATPEYNRSYSPVLKNAIDWGSRPAGKNAWNGLPAGVIGSTLYSLGTFGAQQHLRQVLMYLNMPTLQQPEFYLQNAEEKFDSNGTLTDEYTKQKINEFWTAFLVWIQRNKRDK